MRNTKSVCALHRWGGDGVLSTAWVKGYDPYPLLAEGGSLKSKSQRLFETRKGVSKDALTRAFSKEEGRIRVSSATPKAPSIEVQTAAESNSDQTQHLTANAQKLDQANDGNDEVEITLQAAAGVAKDSSSSEEDEEDFRNQQTSVEANSTLSKPIAQKPFRRDISINQASTTTMNPSRKHLRLFPKPTWPRRVPLCSLTNEHKDEMTRLGGKSPEARPVRDGESIAWVSSATQSPIPPEESEMSFVEVRAYTLPYLSGQLPLLVNLHHQQSQSLPAARPSANKPPQTSAVHSPKQAGSQHKPIASLKACVAILQKHGGTADGRASMYEASSGTSSARSSRGELSRRRSSLCDHNHRAESAMKQVAKKVTNLKQASSLSSTSTWSLRQKP